LRQRPVEGHILTFSGRPKRPSPPLAHTHRHHARHAFEKFRHIGASDWRRFEVGTVKGGDDAVLDCGTKLGE
jgi:hypothetical protein